MKNHFENLRFYLPDLAKMRILDVGSGRGKFLIDCALAGASATGLEIYPPNIELTKDRAKNNGVAVDVREGVAEKLPFDSSTFDFVNLSEVFEHVDNPIAVMREVGRVLKEGGFCYVSIPSRFAVYDPHFHLWLVNWLPRKFAEKYIVFRKREKDYSLGNGRQRLSEMHYHTFRESIKFFSDIGFTARDMRILKLKKYGWYGYFLIPIYILVRPFYFNALHFLLEKSKTV